MTNLSYKSKGYRLIRTRPSISNVMTISIELNSNIEHLKFYSSNLYSPCESNLILFFNIELFTVHSPNGG